MNPYLCVVAVRLVVSEACGMLNDRADRATDDTCVQVMAPCRCCHNYDAMPGAVLKVQPRLLRRSVEAANSALRTAAARGEDRRARLLAKATQAIKAERKSSHAVLIQDDPPSPSLFFFFKGGCP